MTTSSIGRMRIEFCTSISSLVKASVVSMKWRVEFSERLIESMSQRELNHKTIMNLVTFFLASSRVEL